MRIGVAKNVVTVLRALNRKHEKLVIQLAKERDALRVEVRKLRKALRSQGRN